MNEIKLHIQENDIVARQAFEGDPRVVLHKPAPWNDPTIKWVCENHPTKEQGHRMFPFFWRECGGAGMPLSASLEDATV